VIGHWNLALSGLKISYEHIDDLSPSNVSALESHLGTCPACAKVHAEYVTTRQLIHELHNLMPHLLNFLLGYSEWWLIKCA